MTTRVVLVDDHQLVRAGIAALLADLPEVAVIGEGTSGEAAIRLATELTPDVLFLDLVMPGLSGLDALEQIMAHLPDLKVVMLSMHSSEEHVVRALHLGAVGYLLKDSAPEELGLALSTVIEGKVWLSAPISKQVIGEYVRRTRTREGPLNQLTVRQKEVLKLMAEGNGTRDIAELLCLSIKTIETYRAQIMDRLAIHDVAGLVRYAIRHGIVPL